LQRSASQWIEVHCKVDDDVDVLMLYLLMMSMILPMMMMRLMMIVQLLTVVCIRTLWRWC
jgi:hypothetical protein